MLVTMNCGKFELLIYFNLYKNSKHHTSEFFKYFFA